MSCAGPSLVRGGHRMVTQSSVMVGAMNTAVIRHAPVADGRHSPRRVRRPQSAPRRGWFHRLRRIGARRSEHPRPEVRVFPVTDARTGVTHLVTDEAMTTGRRAGCYVSVCGIVVLAASLTAESDKLCSSCRDWARR